MQYVCFFASSETLGRKKFDVYPLSKVMKSLKARVEKNAVVVTDLKTEKRSPQEMRKRLIIEVLHKKEDKLTMQSG